jgi:hypothetical protein
MTAGGAPLSRGAAYSAAGMTSIGRTDFFAVFAARIAAHRSVEIGEHRIAVIRIGSRLTANFSPAARRADSLFARGRPIWRLAGPQVMIRG